LTITQKWVILISW